jgi:hypothetical protein
MATSLRAVVGFTAAGLVLAAAPLFAQPSLTASRTSVAPGTTVTVTVGGTAGQHFAVVGSTVNAGFSFAGQAFALGTDVTIIAVGVLDGTGQATVTFAPPFVGTPNDRYYLQAATSASAAFSPPAVSAGLVLRNADLVTSLAPGYAFLDSLVDVSTVTDTDIISVTIDVPAPGSVLVNAAADVFCLTCANANEVVGYSMWVTDVNGGTAVEPAFGRVPGPSLMTSTGVFRVLQVPAGPRTFYFRAALSAATENLGMVRPRITATYFTR